MRLRLAAALTRLDAARRDPRPARHDRRAGRALAALRSISTRPPCGFAGVVYGRRPPTAGDAGELRERSPRPSPRRRGR